MHEAIYLNAWSNIRIYMHTMYGYYNTNIVQTKASVKFSVKLPINLILAGYLLYLGIE